MHLVCVISSNIMIDKEIDNQQEETNTLQTGLT